MSPEATGKPPKPCRTSAAPTGSQRPSLRRLPDIRAVLFDVYGTLLQTSENRPGQTALQDALRMALSAAGLGSDVDGALKVERFAAIMEREHARMRARGVDYPEVDVREIWGEVLDEACKRAQATKVPSECVIEKMALAYELRVNPVWPMPGATSCLRALRGLHLGIVSNAQFYTAELFDVLLGSPPGMLGFDEALLFYSFEHRRAKPGGFLFERARAALEARGLQPRQVLHVGNDMLNDIAAAGRTGFRTALFAGDGRGLRLREGDPRINGVAPDLVVTYLPQLPGCLV